MSNKEREVFLKRRRNQLLRENKLNFYDPYPYQEKFHNDPSPRRGLEAANKIGKTYCGCPEDSIHTTGRYPDWWLGKKFDHPVKLVCACVNNDKTRDILQKALFGNPIKWEEELGTGWIPKETIGTIQKKRGVPDAFYHVMIRHETDGVFDGWSQITFLAYEMPTETWMAHEADINHLDEEPPREKLDQANRATMATGGITYLTYTPEHGMTDVVEMVENKWSLHTAGWMDVSGGDFTITIAGKEIEFKTVLTRNGHPGHMTEEKVILSCNDYPDYQIPMRAFGKPVLGSGLVYTTEEGLISCDPMDFPDHFLFLDAIDFGGSGSGAHPTAFGRMAYDPDNDVAYIYYGKKYNDKNESGLEIPDIATRIRMQPNTKEIPVIWPHDGNKKLGEGAQTAVQYIDAGVNMFQGNGAKNHFTNPPAAGQSEGEGGIQILPGITEISTRLKDGRMKIVITVNVFFEEYRKYHYKDGEIVDRNDDFMAVARYLIQSIRHAVPIHKKRKKLQTIPRGRSWLS